MKHPLQEVWEENGWASIECPTPRDGLSEGHLCINTWNKAIQLSASFIIADGNPLVAKEKIEALLYEDS